MRLSNFFVAGMLNTVSVGLYHLGQELGRTPTAEVYAPLTRALYPGFALIADKPDRLKANALRACSILSAVVLPIGIGWALIANDFIMLVLGEKWLPIVPIIQVLSPVAGALSVGAIADAIAMSLSRTRLLFYRSLVFFIIQSALFIFGLAQFGLMGAIYLLVLSLVIFLIMQLHILNLLLGFPSYLPLAVTWRSWISVAIMALSIIFVTDLFFAPSSTLGAVFSLFGKIALGAFTYGLCHVVIWLLVGRPDGVEREFLRMWQRRKLQ